MLNEHKVIRLEWQAIHVCYSYLLDEMMPDAVIPHMVKRWLLTTKQEKRADSTNSRLSKVVTILHALCSQHVVGKLPTFCAALSHAKQQHIAEMITKSE